MSALAPLRVLALNEARALLPAFLASVLAAIGATLAAGALHEVSLVALGAATMALGAHALGHEYTHGTLPLMLTLPVERRRLLLVKLTVLAAMVLPLAAYAQLWSLVPEAPWLVWITAAAAICLAPCFTMLCRSELAGAVLSMGLPGAPVATVLIISSALGDRSAGAAQVATAPWAPLLVLVLAGGAAWGWRLFMRLEAIEGSSGELHFGGWLRTSRTFVPGRPLWQLVKKELRLQQLTFALTAWYLVTAWPTATLLRVLGLGDEAASAGAAIYWLCLPVLAGSLASAEERRLGTLSWQFQLPPAARQQWAVKVATVFGVALLVSMVGPLLLAELLWPAARPAGGTAVVLVVVVVVLTAVSLYISSLSASGLRAAVVSLTVVPAIVWLVARWALVLSRTPTPAFWSGRGGGWIGLLSLVVVVLVGLAFLNHRPERPVASHIWRQTLGLAALAAVGIVVLEFLRF